VQGPAEQEGWQGPALLGPLGCTQRTPRACPQLKWSRGRPPCTSPPCTRWSWALTTAWSSSHTTSHQTLPSLPRRHRRGEEAVGARRFSLRRSTSGHPPTAELCVQRVGLVCVRRTPCTNRGGAVQASNTRASYTPLPSHEPHPSGPIIAGTARLSSRAARWAEGTGGWLRSEGSALGPAPASHRSNDLVG